MAVPWWWALIGCSGGGGGAGSPHASPVALDSAAPAEQVPAAEIASFTERETPGRAHQRTLAFRLSRATEGALACTSPDEPDELFVHAFDAAVEGEHTFYGLLARTEYRCTLTTPDDAAELAFTTGDPLPGLVPWEVDGDPEAVWGHYTLLNQFRIGAVDQVVTVFDPEGRVRWTYPMPEGSSTGLETRYLGGGRFLIGGATGFPPAEVDLDGNAVWQLPDPPDGTRYHHDAALTPEGHLLVLRTDEVTDGTNTWTGFVVEEWDVPPTALSWSWRSQRGFDDGALPAGSGDAYHANAVSWVDRPEGPTWW